jgi:hypothetical protein
LSALRRVRTLEGRAGASGGSLKGRRFRERSRKSAAEGRSLATSLEYAISWIGSVDSDRPPGGSPHGGPGSRENPRGQRGRRLTCDARLAGPFDVRDSPIERVDELAEHGEFAIRHRLIVIHCPHTYRSRSKARSSLCRLAHAWRGHQKATSPSANDVCITAQMGTRGVRHNGFALSAIPHPCCPSSASASSSSPCLRVTCGRGGAWMPRPLAG